LHLSKEIPEFRQCKSRVTGQMPLELKLVKLSIVKGAELRNEAEPRPLGKRETLLGFRLDLGERISYPQEVRDQLRAAIGSKCKVADSVGGIEGATCQLASLRGMFRPRYDHVSERHIGSGLIAN